MTGASERERVARRLGDVAGEGSQPSAKFPEGVDRSPQDRLAMGGSAREGELRGTRGRLLGVRRAVGVRTGERASDGSESVRERASTAPAPKVRRAREEEARFPEGDRGAGLRRATPTRPPRQAPPSDEPICRCFKCRRVVDDHNGQTIEACIPCSRRTCDTYVGASSAPGSRRGLR